MADKPERPKNEPAKITNARLARKAIAKGVKATVAKKGAQGQ